MRLAVRAAVAAAVLAIACTASAAADWREPFDDASRINFDRKRNAGELSLAAVGGRPTIAWDEDNTALGAGNASVIRVAQLNLAQGREWDALEGEISKVPTASSFHPSVADVSGAPWVAWAENFNGPAAQIRVARPSPAGGWERVDDRDRPINQTAGTEDVSHADNPVIVDGGDRLPYVAFWQFVLGGGSVLDPSGTAAPANVWVVRLNSDGQWAAVGGGPVNPPATPPAQDGVKDAAMADLAIVGGRVWVTYLQMVKQNAGISAMVRAARLNTSGTGWEQVEPLSVPAGFQPDFRAPDIAAVGGVPVVAVNLASAAPNGPGSILVARPRPDGGPWDPVGGGFASPAGVGASQASLAEVGGTAWVAFNANGAGSAARLANDSWVPSGGPIRDARDGFAGQPQLAAVDGLPWVAFTADDGSTPPAPGQRGCCAQVRAARLVPDFDAATVYPAATTAAVLGAMDTFGLSYPLGLETTPQGGSPAESVFTPLNASQALGELRGLKPGTVHAVRPFAIAGTPDKVFGPVAQFVTPPDGERPHSRRGAGLERFGRRAGAAPCRRARHPARPGAPPSRAHVAPPAVQHRSRRRGIGRPAQRARPATDQQNGRHRALEPDVAAEARGAGALPADRDRPHSRRARGARRDHGSDRALTLSAKRGTETCRSRTDPSGPSRRGSSGKGSRRRLGRRWSSAAGLRAPRPPCCGPPTGRLRVSR